MKYLDLAALLVAFYGSIVWGTYIYLNVTPIKKIVILFIIVVEIEGYFLSKFMINNLEKIEIVTWQMTKKQKGIVFISVALITFIVMLIWLLGYYPGSFSPDSIAQYTQAISGKYDDWHPAWHTLVFFTFPLKVFKVPASIIVMQILYFALILGFLVLTICELSNVKIAVISFAYIILNPYVGYIMLYPWKDVGFGLASLLVTVISVRLIFKQSAKEKLWKCILLGIVIASATIFRHNAILYTGSLLIVLFFNLDKKTWIKIFIFTIAAFIIIKFPVYDFFEVSKAEKRIVEETGLPLTVIGNVAKETPELMDEELSKFVYSLAAPEQWQESYQCGNFNNIKWIANLSAVEEQGVAGMLRLMMKCFRLSPKASIDAVIALTDMVYGFENGMEGNVSPGIAENIYGITYSPPQSEKCQALVSSYAAFINTSVFRYFRTYGICLFVILVTALSKLKFNSWNSWKKAFMVIPIFVYDFGTMLLLTGPDSRFFFITFLVTPLLIVWAFSKEN